METTVNRPTPTAITTSSKRNGDDEDGDDEGFVVDDDGKGRVEAFDDDDGLALVAVRRLDFIPARK